MTTNLVPVDSGLPIVDNTDQVQDTKLSLDDIISNEIDNTYENEDNLIDVQHDGKAIAKTSVKQGSPKPGQQLDKGKVAVESDKAKNGIPAKGPDNAQNDILEAPKHWPVDRQSVFNSLPINAKQAWIAQAKDYEKGYTDQANRLSAHKKYAEDMEVVLKPWEQHIQQMGMTKHQAVGTLVKFYGQMVKDPIGAIQLIMHEAKLTPEHLGLGSQNQADPSRANLNDPAILAVNNELRQLRQSQAQVNDLINGALHKQGEQRTANYIETMSDIVDDNGNKLYPHVNEDGVMIQMAQVIENNPALKSDKDVGKTLDMAYKLVIAANHDHFVQLAAEQRSQQVNHSRTLAAKPARPGPGSNVRTNTGKPDLDNILTGVFDQFGL